MRLWPLAFALLLSHSALAETAPAEPAPPVTSVAETAVDAYRSAWAAMVEAYKAGDGERMLQAVQRMAKSRPQLATVHYQRAAALATLGRTDEALTELETLADLGLITSASAEPAFKPLHAMPRWERVLERMQALAEPTGQTDTVRSVDTLPGDFIPEALAWDEASGRLFLGSVRQRRIALIDREGKLSDFVPAGRDGLMSVLGMHIHGDAMWVASAGLEQARPADPALAGRSGVFVFALADGALRNKWLLPEDGKPHGLGDLLMLSDGSVLASDSLSGQIWLLDPRTGQWRERVAEGVLPSPQGMALLDSGRVFVADWSAGLFILDIAGNEPPRSAERRQPMALHGIDGLYRHGDTLIAIQNGTRPQRIVSLALQGEAIGELKVLAASQPDWDEPTLGQIIGNAFWYVANSHWPRFDEKGELPDAATLAPPRVMKIAL